MLLDFQLPGGDAVVVLKRLRQVASLATVPVIVVTARGDDAAEELARGAGAMGFLRKPFEAQTLLMLLSQAFAWPVQLIEHPSGAVFRRTPAT